MDVHQSNLRYRQTGYFNMEGNERVRGLQFTATGSSFQDFNLKISRPCRDRFVDNARIFSGLFIERA
jgi:hypothetical protein